MPVNFIKCIGLETETQFEIAEKLAYYINFSGAKAKNTFPKVDFTTQNKSLFKLLSTSAPKI
jgi:hypothetical protein